MKLVTFYFLIITTSVLSCTCPEYEELKRDSISKTQIAFTGKVVSIKFDTTLHTNIIEFAIEKPLLRVSNSDTIKILSLDDTGMCGLRIEEGEIWYIYPEMKNENGYYWESMCGRSVNLTKPKAKYRRKKFRVDKRRYKRDKRIIGKL